MNGVYHGVDIWHRIRSQRARLKGDPPPAPPEDPHTDIGQFDGTGTFSGGTMQNEDFTMQIPFLRLNGHGTVNLLEATLNYQLEARVTETPRFDDGETIDDLNGIVLPIVLSGALDSPNVRVDLGAAAASWATQQLRNRLLEALETDDEQTEGEPAPEESSRDRIKRGLRELLKQ